MRTVKFKAGDTILKEGEQGDTAFLNIDGSVEITVGERGKGGKLVEGEWKHRPVGIAQGLDGALYFTSDDSGEVLRLGYGRE